MEKASKAQAIKKLQVELKQERQAEVQRRDFPFFRLAFFLNSVYF